MAAGRLAGQGLNLSPELVRYIGAEAMAGRTSPELQTPQDVAIVEGIAQALDEQGLLAGGPSFNLKVPKIPGRDLEGAPNADNPLMREKLRQRLLRNPNGTEDLPAFVQGA